jgi:peptide/nickel transport system permease protein
MGTASVLLNSEPKVARRAWPASTHGFIYTLSQNRLNLAGALLTIVLIVGAAIGPLLLADPFATTPADRFQAPSLAHWAGTDNLGRDQLARITLGLRLSILVSIGAVALGMIVGVPLGLISGYYGGVGDNLIMRVLDILFAFPGLLLALAMIAALGSSTQNLVLTMGVLFAPSMARVTRGPVLSIRQKEFIEAARALGVREIIIIYSHILPNVVAPIIVAATLQLSAAILIEASLGFLGLGINPPNPSLGGLINASRTFMGQGPWMAIFPGLAITLLIIGFNLVGDGLRDAVDPRLRDVLDSRTAIR